MRCNEFVPDIEKNVLIKITLTEEMEKPLHDSGNRTNMAGTGALRDLDPLAKGRFDLLPYEALLEVAIHFADGAEKYAPRNWEKGLPLDSYLNSGLRHGFQLNAGLVDERHDRAWAWNALCYIWTRVKIIKGELPLELAKDVKEYETIKKLRKEYTGGH